MPTAQRSKNMPSSATVNAARKPPPAPDCFAAVALRWGDLGALRRVIGACRSAARDRVDDIGDGGRIGWRLSHSVAAQASHGKFNDMLVVIGEGTVG
jgi:hypothetical protein